ncbi:unnamed protein product [Ixodes persulcatus]
MFIRADLCSSVSSLYSGNGAARFFFCAVASRGLELDTAYRSTTPCRSRPIAAFAVLVCTLYFPFVS